MVSWRTRMLRKRCMFFETSEDVFSVTVLVREIVECDECQLLSECECGCVISRGVGVIYIYMYLYIYIRAGLADSVANSLMGLLVLTLGDECGYSECVCAGSEAIVREVCVRVGVDGEGEVCNRWVTIFG